MGRHLQGAFASKDPARFATLLEQSEDVKGTLDILLAIPNGLECAVVNQLSPNSAGRILGQVPDSTLIEWLDSGPVVDGRRTLSKIAPDRAGAVISGIGDSAKRRELRRLAAYPQDSIGRLMQLDVILLMQDDTVTEIDARIQRHKGSVDGPIVIQHQDGTFAGVLDPVRFLQNRGNKGTAVDSCIRLEPVFADSPVSLLLDPGSWAGQNRLPVVDYERKPIGFVTRSMLESTMKTKAGYHPQVNTLVQVSEWYWRILLQGMMIVLDRRPER